MALAFAQVNEWERPPSGLPLASLKEALGGDIRTPGGVKRDADLIGDWAVAGLVPIVEPERKRAGAASGGHPAEATALSHITGFLDTVTQAIGHIAECVE
jgi:hypothetical protein